MPRELVTIRCPHCRFRFKVDAKYGGRTTRCPKEECGGKLRIPQVKVVQVEAAREDGGPGENAERRRRPKRKTGSNLSRQQAANPKADDYDLDARGASPVGRSKSSSHSRRPQRPNSKKGNRSGSRRGQSHSVFRAMKTWQAAVGLGGVIIAVLCIILAPNGAPPISSIDPVAAADDKPQQPQVDHFNKTLQPFLKKYCQDCHSQDDPQAGIDLLAFHSEAEMLKGKNRKTWEMVLSMIEIGAMPPVDMDQPQKGERQKLVAYLEDKLFNLDCDAIDDPGRVTVRRLNRTEYNNTVRDLLGVDFKPADDFPSDDVGYGFDNIGDVLSLSPLLMEKYLDAAEKITSQAIPVISSNDDDNVIIVDKMRYPSNFRTSRGFIGFYSNGEARFDYTAPIDGNYTFKIDAMADQYGNELAKMHFRVDGKDQKVFNVRGKRTKEVYSHTQRLSSGKHVIKLIFTNDAYRARVGDRNLYVGTVRIDAPKVPAKTDGFVSVRPGKGKSVKQAAQEILKPFVDRAFRRPAIQSELDRYVGVVEMAVKEGESFDDSIRYAVQAVLVSPSFLFRVETDQQPDNPMSERQVTDYELASRLSYFIWSTMPDQKLFDLAAAGKLRQPVVLEQQVKRMLADSRSKALTDNFAEQWLNLRSLDEINPDPNLFKGFNTALKNDMKRETLLLFDTIRNEDRSILDFLDADFTFVNNRLAKHYGMKSIGGNEFQKVSLDTSQRSGVLTHASILMITSNPDRTSPVKRGKWIMENILGTSPPPPPPNVPELEATQKAEPNASLRKQLEIHRKDPGCASCHRTMDTLGFAFENFDAVGNWRDKDGQHAIDPAGVLPSGEEFKGAVELVKVLKTRKRQFSRCLAEKMLTYALGRGLEYYDRCATDEILDRLDRNNYRFSQLVIGIVNSRPFLNRRGDGERE